MTERQQLTVVIDQQEKKPWSLSLPTVTRHLRTGDYSISGLEEVLTVERKSLGDFINTVIHEWLRFRKELYRMSSMDAACVVVEATLDDVLQKRYEAEVHPHSILGRANGIFLDHGIPVFWWGPRAATVNMVERYFMLAWDKYKHLAKNTNTEQKS